MEQVTFMLLIVVPIVRQWNQFVARWLGELAERTNEPTHQCLSPAFGCALRRSADHDG
ncbi:MAG: hypothetical protein HYR72_27000 [Deltaproteobacteria bacterium]|nr:hypothetical protein [Deltaproteobacteria bacterium]